MTEEFTPWDVDVRIKQPDIRAALERELPEIASRVAFSAPLAGGTDIYPLDNKHLRLTEDMKVERHVEGERFLVRINDMREDPGFYGLFPENDHELSRRYEELMSRRTRDEGQKQALEKEALEIAKQRVGQFDELLERWQKESGDTFILPFYHRYFINEESDHPLMVTVVQDFSDGYENLMVPDEPHEFSAAARHVPGLRGELTETIQAYARIFDTLADDAPVPTDIIWRWDQFGLVQAGGQQSVALIDNEPFLDAKAVEQRTQTTYIKRMARELQQLPQSTPLKDTA